MEPNLRHGAARRASIARAKGIAGVEISETVLPPGQVVRRHRSTHTELCFVLSGSLRIGDVAQPVRRGEALLRSGHKLGALRAAADGARVLLIHLDRGWHGWALAQASEPADALFRYQRTSAVARTAHALRNELTADEHASPAVLWGLALAALGHAQRDMQPPSRAPDWLAGVREALESGRRYSLDALARDAGVHRGHLTRTFRRHTGMSIGAYARELRIQTACRLLSEPNANIQQIALQCGFADQSHLSRAFRRAMGLSPKRYRERAIEGVHAAGRALLNPVGRYVFSSTTADGTPYDGSFEIRGRPGAYSGRASTPVLPDIEFTSVATYGTSMTIVADAPAGSAIIRLSFSGAQFEGSWTLGGHGARLRGRRVR